ncbi:aldo/keto reductase [Intestinibacter sp.]|uniref:aldo/keto reductase n=1 Tax=Intestinibacter sp. TaxID=1965304 RepID=UPI002A760CA4|nr:aldo/keto reductase [Intestinibacter sp.]MDY2736204.1 aldo/keto reductase [Intestinibacter sp.]
MKYRTLGRTNIKVSEVGLGGEGFEKKTQEEVTKMIDTAIKEGINYIDIYNSNPEVRSYVGNALKKYPRESFVIEGHLCTTWEDNQYKRTRNIDEVKEAYKDFLDRMQLDYVDVGMIHYIDDDKDFDSVFYGEIIEYAKELQSKGIIKHLGISTHNPDIALRAVKTGIIDVILFSINAAYDMLPASEDVDILFEEDTYKDRIYQGIEPKREKLYRICENEGVALTVMKAFGAGVLLNEKQSPFKKALTPVKCLHYCLTRPAVATVAIGASNVDEILSSVYYEKATDEEKDYAKILADAPKSAFTGQCMYCGHCAPCSVKIDIAYVNKYLDLASIQDELAETVKNHYELLAHHASECIECGLCMDNCPFGVDIIGKMKEAAKLFGK